MNGIITKAISSFYYIKTPDGAVFECRAKGVLKRKISPCVGDIAIFDEAERIVLDVAPRRNHFLRPPMANLDQLAFVVSTIDPVPNFLVLDKLLAACVHKEINPIILITKSDLMPPDFLEIYRDFDVFVNPTLASLRHPLGARFTAFVGNSGVGKSTLLNSLFGFSLQTGETSKKLGRGKHTTRAIEIFEPFSGMLVADTPGFSAVDFSEYLDIPAREVQLCFPEITAALERGRCKYDDCTHTSEPACAVREALHPSRYSSYLTLFEEMKLKERSF